VYELTLLYITSKTPNFCESGLVDYTANMNLARFIEEGGTYKLSAASAMLNMSPYLRSFSVNCRVSFSTKGHVR
jgi:hypothetical protein